ncbi:MAG TPA: hypothetical protein VGC30_05965, partial [Dokdonella sp.]
MRLGAARIAGELLGERELAQREREVARVLAGQRALLRERAGRERQRLGRAALLLERARERLQVRDLGADAVVAADARQQIAL